MGRPGQTPIVPFIVAKDHHDNCSALQSAVDQPVLCPHIGSGGLRWQGQPACRQQWRWRCRCLRFACRYERFGQINDTTYAMQGSFKAANLAPAVLAKKL